MKGRQNVEANIFQRFLKRILLVHTCTRIFSPLRHDLIFSRSEGWRYLSSPTGSPITPNGAGSLAAKSEATAFVLRLAVICQQWRERCWRRVYFCPKAPGNTRSLQKRGASDIEMCHIFARIKVAMLKVEYILYINVLNMWDHRIRLLGFHSIGSFEPTNHCPLSPSSVAHLRLRSEHFAHRPQGNAGQYPVCPCY